MASSSTEQVTVTPEDEDIRGDGKKRKFKPLSAMRKLFSGRSKRKKESVVAVKAQSTTALHSGFDDNDDDDDGGFKTHQSKPTLAGNRSISEDSIFSPGTTISNFPTSAVSEESVPKAKFQSELLSKLSHRRSQYSDEDDGLPRSPVQPITSVADVINGDYSVKAVTSGKRNINQGSAQSLISVDSSENEEDNLFTAKWKTSVPSRKTGGSNSSARMSEGSTSDEPLDFSNIQKTELLKSTAAKDRISIKPQSRRASRLSRKKRETSQSLPSLNEESPLKIKVENDSVANKKSNASKDWHQPKLETNGTSAKVSPAMNIENQSPKAPVSVLSSSAPSFGIMVTSAPSLNLGDTEATSPQQDSRSGDILKKKDEVKKANIEIDKPKDAPMRSSIKARAAGFETSKPSETSKNEGTSLKVSDPASRITSSPREDYKIKRQTRSKTIPVSTTEEETTPKVQRASSQRVQTSSAFDQSPTKEPKPEKTSTTKEPSQMQTSMSGSIIKKQESTKFSRQDSGSTQEPDWINLVRKKKEEQMVGNDKEKEAEELAKNDSKPSDAPSSGAVNSLKSSFSSVKSVFSSNNSQAQKRGSIDNTNMSMDQKRGSIDNTNISKDQKRGSIDNTNISKDQKRGSIDNTNMSKDQKRASIDYGSAGQAKDNKHAADAPKKEDNPKETPTSTTKRPSIDIGSVRKESLEINVSELNSVKAMTNSFSSGSKRDGIASRWNPTKNDDPKTSVPSSSTATTSYSTSSTSERAKMFSGASASSSPAPSTSTSGPNSSKPPSSGISHSRFGSVKTSPTKSVEAKSVFAGRGGSVKATTQNSSSTASPSKSESISPASKLEPHSSTSETKAVTSSTTSLGTHSSSTSSNRPPPHPNSSFTHSTPKPVSPISPTQSKPSYVKPGSIGVKASPFSVAKPTASTPASASNMFSSSVSSSKSSTPAITTSSSISSSSSSSSSATSASSSQTKTSPIRSYASFTSSSSHKPQISTSPASSYSPSNVLSKSSSMKASSTEVPKQEKETTTPKVPAWRANLPKKEVKIEIIEKSNNSSPSSNTSTLSSSTKNKNENAKKMGDSSRVAEMAKTSETRSSSVSVAEKTSHRSSKVLDLVKNFQNLQVSS